MKIGRLDRKVTLFKPNAEDDGMGGRGISEWLSAADVWAEFMRPRTAAVGVDGGVASVQVQEIKIRWRSDVAPGWRLKYGGELWEIEHVFSANRRETSLVARLVEYPAP